MSDDMMQPIKRKKEREGACKTTSLAERGPTEAFDPGDEDKPTIEKNIIKKTKKKEPKARSKPPRPAPPVKVLICENCGSKEEKVISSKAVAVAYASTKDGGYLHYCKNCSKRR